MNTTKKNIKTSDKLVHAGVKGMRWGIRRYQNLDGSLTEEGRKRYKTAGKVLSDSSKITGELSTAIGNHKVKTPRMDLSKMSNKEMQDRIQREILEKQYDQMFNTERRRSEAGRDTVQSVMKGLTTALSITATSLGIALAIKELRSKTL